MKRILFIEDNDDLRENIVEILLFVNFEVLIVFDGCVGVEFVVCEKFDFIICDIMVLVFDGYGVLYLLLCNLEIVFIFFIFLMVKVERFDFRKGMEMGVDDYLIKFFDDIELFNVIEICIWKVEVKEGI